MRIQGVDLGKPHEEILVLPRGKHKVIFKARAVISYDKFDSLVERPKPPIKVVTKVGKTEDYDSPRYKDALKVYSERRFQYLILESLKATEELEWSKVDYENPETWGLYEEDLKSVNFSETEIARIINLVMTANSLNESAIDEAREAFLQGQAEAELS